MKIAFYDTHSYDKQSFDEANKAFGFEIHYNEFEQIWSEQKVFDFSEKTV